MSAGRQTSEREPARSGAQRVISGSFAEGRYEVRERLAEGKRAQIYTARHVPTGQVVVLKLLSGERQQDREAQRRLRREAIALRRTRHPGIVRILDSGTHEGHAFIALEYLQGRSLAGLLAARGRFSVPEVLELGIRLTDVLGDAHVAGVIHRDLKPAHVFCVHGGGLKLIDFGSASVPELFETEETEGITLDGVPIGTPEYMPPEALRGSADPLGRADIYALGVVLFELLTGTVPYPGSLPAVVLGQARGAPPSLRALRPDVPTAVRTAIERCLALELDERYTSAADLAVDLELARDFPAVSVCSRRPPVSVPGRVPADSPLASFVKPGAEARRFARAPFTAAAVFTTAQGETFSGRVEEISEGGAQFMCEQQLELGLTGQLRFSLPLTGKVCVAAVKTQWARAGRVNLHAAGFEFAGLDADAASQIRRYVQLMQGNPGGAHRLSDQRESPTTR
jgi:serine/threonine protein kinase